MNTVIEYILAQNPLLMVLLGTSVVCGAVILDRTFFWLTSAAAYRPIPPQIYCSKGPGTAPLINATAARKHKHYTEEILLAGLEKGGCEDNMAQTALELTEKMSARLGMLDLIARTAPLVGILGTVVGMSVSFGGIGQMTIASPAAISSGISVALQTTAWGLVISICATVASTAFRKFVNQATVKMGRIICEIQSSQNQFCDDAASAAIEPGGNG